MAQGLGLVSPDPLPCVSWVGSGHETRSIILALSTGPTPKIGKGTWCHLQKFPYVLCQQSLFGVEKSHSSITNYQILDT